MNVILFGPPGIGKSSIIRELVHRGYRAIDLEDLWPSEIRFELPNVVDGVIFGGADLDPNKYPNAFKVLLWADQNVYEARRARRDAHEPGKASQRSHQVAEWLDGPWDMKVKAVGSMFNTIDRIKSKGILKKLRLKSTPSKKEDHDAV